MDKFIQLAAAGLGTLGFALLFNVRGRKLVFAAIGGVLAWGVYLLAFEGWENDYMSAFCATVALSLYAEIMAIVHRTPVTVFLVSAAIPLIPGAALYRTMDAAVHQDWAGFVAQGGHALLFAASLAMGMTATTVFFQFLRGLLRRLRR